MEPGDTSAAPNELEALLASTLERIEREGGQALEQVCSEHPAVAPLLRQRVLALRELGLIQAWSSERPPQRLGDFRLLRRIGSGGMGVVYHAHQESLHRDVALKLIRPETLHLPGARERFARETMIIARLQHPGIVPIYSVGGVDELPYYAMELVRGCTLADALAKLAGTPTERLSGADLARAVQACSEPLESPQPVSALYDGTWEQASLRILLLVAEALDHAHGRGVLHRDLKPSNVMLTLGGRVMLVDFGLSHTDGSDSVTKSGERAGSLPFMPPELLKHGLRGIDRRADIYSLGVTLYLLLTRRPPYAGENEIAVYERILEGRPPRPRSLAPTISWEAETVCLAAMDLDPERRYATAVDLARDLANALARRPIQARRASAWLRLRRWIETRPATAAALALAVLTPTALALAKVQEARRLDGLRNLANTERGIAQANFSRSLRTVDAMLGSLGASRLDHVPGVGPLRIELLGEAQALYLELFREHPEQPSIAIQAAEVGIARAKLIGRLESWEAARTAVNEVLQFLGAESLRGQSAVARLEAGAFLLLSIWSPEPADREAYRAASTGMLVELAAQDPRDEAVQALLAECLSSTLLEARASGSRHENLAALEVAEGIARDLVRASGSWSARSILARVAVVRGAHAAREGRLEDALAPLRESLHLREGLLEEQPENEEARADVCESASALAGVLLPLKCGREGLELLEHAAREVQCLIDDFPEVKAFHVRAADVYLNLGAAQGQMKNEPLARAALERAREVYRRLVDLDPRDSALRQSFGTTLLNLADSELLAGDPAAAQATCAESLGQFEAALALEPDHPDYRAWLAPERSTRAKILLAQGRVADAAEALAEAPRLAGHLPQRAIHALKRLLIAVKRAQSEGDSGTIDRCLAAARLAIELAHERGDIDADPTLAALEALVEER